MNFEQEANKEETTLEQEEVVSKEIVRESTPVEDNQAEEPATQEPQPDGKEKKGWKRELIEWIESLGIAIVVVLLLTNFVFRFVVVSGSSMEPTLHDKNRLFVYRLGYEPENGDIIVFEPRGAQNQYYVKRVIATEGQTVDIRDGDVYVDGVKLEEEYIAAKIMSDYPGQYPKTVPEDCVFVLGDNRNASRDSRDETGVGMVEEKSIVGKALFRILPLNEIGGLYDNYNLK
ncbi:MAG: signal peptidase I [Clostridia bacterium]|nr:signal peptidase I [Clostridia bacterium]